MINKVMKEEDDDKKSKMSDASDPKPWLLILHEPTTWHVRPAKTQISLDIRRD